MNCPQCGALVRPDARFCGKFLTSVSAWVGLGGDVYHNPQSTVLWQAGTANDRVPCGSASTGACSTATFWYEDFGCSSPCPGNGWRVDVPNPVVHPGDSVSVLLSADGAVTFTNLTTHESATVSVPIDDTKIGLSAEWIAEESGGCPTPRGRWPYYACSYVPFADPVFTAASASGSTVGGPLDALVWTRAELTDQNGHVLARPGPPTPATHGFGVTCCAP
jgi:Peptidase A4 family